MAPSREDVGSIESRPQFGQILSLEGMDAPQLRHVLSSCDIANSLVAFISKQDKTWH